MPRNFAQTFEAYAKTSYGDNDFTFLNVVTQNKFIKVLPATNLTINKAPKIDAQIAIRVKAQDAPSARAGAAPNDNTLKGAGTYATEIYDLVPSLDWESVSVTATAMRLIAIKTIKKTELEYTNITNKDAAPVEAEISAMTDLAMHESQEFAVKMSVENAGVNFDFTPATTPQTAVDDLTMVRAKIKVLARTKDKFKYRTSKNRMIGFAVQEVIDNIAYAQGTVFANGPYRSEQKLDFVTVDGVRIYAFDEIATTNVSGSTTKVPSFILFDTEAIKFSGFSKNRLSIANPNVGAYSIWGDLCWTSGVVGMPNRVLVGAMTADKFAKVSDEDVVVVAKTTTASR